MDKNKNKIKDLEKKSSAITLSDMEIFVFPELLYSLVLANIMSPALWKWKEDPWFDGIKDKSVMGKIKRLKQYIMDNYVFNLDLNTWGLTDKNRELDRFKDFISPADIEKTNALFGYEGDKYYFDIDIRRHFGLDGYNDDIIPYWKTETIEAMDAFNYRDGFNSGAGECVSLSVLYAAAMFVVLEIPLDDIFLIATPLHSQNYINSPKGVLTNNRRIITKNKWFNGTPLSMKARRALENENITIVASNTGYIHTYYPEATIDKKQYENFQKNLSSFLKEPLNKKILGSFLRGQEKIHECIQYRHTAHGKECYIELEKIFRYEEDLPYFFTHDTRNHLLDEIDSEEFHMSQIPDRIILNDLENYIADRDIDLGDEKEIKSLQSIFAQDCMKSYRLVKALVEFCITEPKYPDRKRFSGSKENIINLSNDMSRESIVERLEKLSAENKQAELAFYAFRDMRFIEPEVYLTAAVERNPVSAEVLKDKTRQDLIKELKAYKDESIYSSPYRLAQPDEVVNFKTGDGFEKAVTAANVIVNNNAADKVSIEITAKSAVLNVDGKVYEFKTGKDIGIRSWQIKPGFVSNKIRRKI